MMRMDDSNGRNLVHSTVWKALYLSRPNTAKQAIDKIAMH